VLACLAIVIKKVLVDKPEMRFTLIVDQRPYSAAFDPYCKFIDKQWDDNILTVSRKN